MSVFTDEELSMISALAEKQVLAEQQVELLKESLELAEKTLRQVSDKDLPSAMQEIGMSAFTLTSGRKITVKEVINASIPKDNSGPAFAWLRNNNFGGMIKNQIIAEFGKGEDDDAIRAATILVEAGFQPTQKETVHPMTLKSFIKEQREKGTDIPLEAFGAFIFNRATVK